MPKSKTITKRGSRTNQAGAGSSYVVVDGIFHANIGKLSFTNLFKACFDEGVTFDCDATYGTILHFIDSLVSGYLGFMTIAPTLREAIYEMDMTLDCIGKQLGIVRHKQIHKRNKDTQFERVQDVLKALIHSIMVEA